MLDDIITGFDQYRSNPVVLTYIHYGIAFVQNNKSLLFKKTQIQDLSFGTSKIKERDFLIV